jgi:Putative peptidoglycan binding domain
MRLFFILICSVALVCFVPGVEAGKKKDKKQAQSSAVSKKDKHGKAKSAEWSKSKKAGKPHKGNSWNNQKYSKKGKSWSSANNEWAGEQAYKYKTKVKTKHYSLSYKYNPTIQNVKFQKSYHIKGSEYWNGARYAAFRNYHPEWHDQSWWRNHYKRVVFISGGWYYWNAGWWYPAWGYAPNAYYAYNGPIYAYNDLPPDQVVANVQVALQQQGYYQGDVDGLLGPLTRAAIATYQRDRGLYVTSAIDQPTLESLGMS